MLNDESAYSETCALQLFLTAKSLVVYLAILYYVLNNVSFKQ